MLALRKRDQISNKKLNNVSKSVASSNNTMPKKCGILYNVAHRSINTKTYRIKRLHRWGVRTERKSGEIYIDDRSSNSKQYEIARLNDEVISNSFYDKRFAFGKDSTFYGYQGSNNISMLRYNSLCNSKIIFNGTFPIDEPFGIRKNFGEKLQVFFLD